MKDIDIRLQRPDDACFLRQLYATSRQDEVAQWGWPEDLCRAFLDMQFQLQWRSYETRFPRMECSIILRESKPVGRFLVNTDSQEYRLIDIAILPIYQKLGTGTYIIRKLQHKADELRVPFRLSVLRSNHACNLYERLGFVAYQEDAVYISLQYP